MRRASATSPCVRWPDRGPTRLSTMRRSILVALLAAGAIALASSSSAEEPEPRDPTAEEPGATRLRLEVDPHGLAKELARVDSYARGGKNEDAISTVDRLLRDARARDGWQIAKHGGSRTRILTSFARALRTRLLAAPEAARQAFDARFDDDARHLEEQGKTDPGALAKLLVRFPFSSRAARAGVELAARELESGRPDAAAAWLQSLVEEQGERMGPALLARVRVELVGALALAGREGEAERVLDRLSGPAAESARGLLAAAKTARAGAVEAAPGRSLPAVGWAHDVLDFYELPGTKTSSHVEPSTDGERLYVQDGSHALALELETGKVAWRASLRPRDDGYHETKGACRVALGPSVVACALPLGAVVSVDRATGDVLFRLRIDELKKMAKIEDEAAIVPSLVVSGPALVVPIEARHADDELILLGIDARTGAFLWKLFVVGEPADHLAGNAVLAAGPDAVYVLSNRGVVGALEPHTGSALWLRRYPSLRDSATPDPRRGRGLPAGGAPARPGSGFLTYQHGRLLVAPGDSPRLFVLDPRTGDISWEVNDGAARVLGVWKNGLLELTKDGALVHVYKEVEPKGKLDVFALNGTPAVAGDALFLPVESGLKRIDLTRRGEAAVSVAAEWHVLGGRKVANLACSGGRLLAVTEARQVALAETAPEVAAVPSDAKVAGRLLSDPSWAVRQAAFATLVGLGEASLAELERLSQSADPEQRIRAIDALDEIARKDRIAVWKPRVKEEWNVLDRLTHRNAEVRLEAVRALGAIEDEEVKPLLSDLLNDKDARVQGSAAIALFRRGDRTGMALVEKMFDSPLVEDRMAAVNALYDKGAVEDLPLAAKAVEDENTEVRARAAGAALRCGGEKGIPIVEKLLADKDDKVRSDLFSAIVTLKIGASATAPIFAKFAKDPQRGIREQALRVLGEKAFRHEKVALEAFANALLDPDQGVARMARASVVNLDKHDVAKFPCATIEKVFDDPQLAEGDRFHFVQIAEAILDGGAPFAAAPLAKTALQAENPQLRKRALEVLFRRSQNETPFTAADVMAVGSLTRSKDEDVRFDAYQSLANANGPGVGSALLHGLDEPNEQVREFVERKLKTLVEPGLLAELLRREATATKPAEQAAAAGALDWRPDEKRDVLAPVLLEALADADTRVRARAWKRIRDLAHADEDLGFFEPDGKPDDRAASVRRAASWWWRRAHSKAPETIAKDLAANNPSIRWKAAKKLMELGARCFKSLARPELIDTIAKAASEESVEHVLRQELAVVALLTGKPCEVKETATPAERAKAVRIALDWRK